MKEIECLPEYFVCKLDVNHNIKFKGGTLLLGPSMFNDTNENEKYIFWSVLNNYHKNISGHYANYSAVYEEWKLYGKRSDDFFETFKHLMNKYATNEDALKKHLKILQQLQSDRTRKKQ